MNGDGHIDRYRGCRNLNRIGLDPCGRCLRGEMRGGSAYTRQERNKAVNLSAVLGWAAVVFPLAYDVGSPIIFYYAIIIGLPISFFLCWLIAAPALTLIMRKEVGFLAAGAWGSALAGAVYCLYIPTFGSAFGPLFGNRAEWQDHMVSLVIMVLVGTAIGAIIRWAIGSGSGSA